jgi:hypothetical protein
MNQIILQEKYYLIGKIKSSQEKIKKYSRNKNKKIIKIYPKYSNYFLHNLKSY